jgi:hypothetical protein
MREPDFRAIASATSTSDERNFLWEILTKASAKRSASGSNATDFVALGVVLVAGAPPKSSLIGTSSGMATRWRGFCRSRIFEFAGSQAATS